MARVTAPVRPVPAAGKPHPRDERAAHRDATRETSMRWLIGLFAVLVLAPSAAVVSPAGAAAPCTTASAACLEWVAVPGGTMQTAIYRSHALGERADGVTTAFLLVHGAGRDAHSYFRSALAATFLAGALDRTEIGRASCRDSATIRVHGA